MTPGGEQWWGTTRELWPTDFAEDINAALRNERSEIVSWAVSMPFFAERDPAAVNTTDT